MWMLVATLCIAWGDEAECVREVWPQTSVGVECGKMRKPLRDYLTEMTKDSGGKLLFVTVGCKRGLDT